MGISELGKVQPAKQVFATINTRRANGVVDPICRMDIGLAPSDVEEDGSLLFVARDGESDDSVSRNRLGTIQLDDIHDGIAEMVLDASTDLAEKPGLLRLVAQSVLEEAGVEHAVVVADVDTNLSGDVLRQAGAVALYPGIYEFQVAA